MFVVRKIKEMVFDEKSHKTEYFDLKDNNHIIFSLDDQRLDLLGQIFGNKTSRDIFASLIGEEMTAMQISDKLGIKLNLVLYHLNKMMELQIILVTRTTKNSRGHQVKHYGAKQAVMIFSKKAKNKAEKSKMLSNVIKRITRFSAIGMTGVLTWFVTSISTQGSRILESSDASLKYPRPTLPPYMMPIEPQLGTSLSPELLMPIILSSIVVASLLTIDRIFCHRIQFVKENKN